MKDANDETSGELLLLWWYNITNATGTQGCGLIWSCVTENFYPHAVNLKEFSIRLIPLRLYFFLAYVECNNIYCYMVKKMLCSQM